MKASAENAQDVREEAPPEEEPANAPALDTRPYGVLNSYIEKAFEEFLEHGRRLEETVRKQELQAEKEFRDTEKKLIEGFHSSLSQAVRTHEQTISSSIKAYEEALRKAAQSFITAKEESEETYLDKVRKADQDFHRQLEEARLVRNTEVDSCRRRLASH